MHSKWEYNKIKQVKQIFTKNFILIAIMFNIFFFVFAKILAYTLFGEKFITSWIILQYSILLLIFNYLFQINFNILAWIWKVKNRVKIVLIAVLFNFIMNLILIKSIWVFGAALSTWFWWILIYILSELFLWKKYRVKFDYLSIIKNIAIIWTLWWIIYKFWLNIFIWVSRFNSLLLLAMFFWIWFLIFIIINYNQFKIFIIEIKKLRKWK